jgi:hypothetical protein
MICHAMRMAAGISHLTEFGYTTPVLIEGSIGLQRRVKDFAKERREVVVMLSALEQQAREAAVLAEKAHRHASRDCYSSYLHFRTKINEFQSLVALIETRLERLGEEQRAELYDKFRQLDTVMVVMMVRASARFFALMKQSDALPLGARELLMPEQRRLTDVRGRMEQNPEEVERMSPGIVAILDEALVGIEVLIERAPSLPEW